MPPPAGRTEDDWVQLCKDEELNGARLSALKDYEDALRKFPTSLSLQKAEGRLSADLLRYDEAVNLLEPVQSRETWNSETGYYLGIAYDGLDREREARIAFEGAQRLSDFHAAANVRLAELEARQGQLQRSADDLKEALRSTPDDLRSAEELVAVDHAIGQTDSARVLATQWLARYPTSYFLREELGQPDNAHLAADVDRILNIAAEYMRLGLYETALKMLSRDYPDVPADQREPADVMPQKHPLVAYYRGYCKQKLGESPSGEYAAAAKLSTKYIFPSGAMTYSVLQSAAQANPQDASANYLLGTLQFSIGKTDAGLERWKQARLLNPKLPTVDVSIGLALLHIKEDVPGALSAFQASVINDPDNVGGYFGLDQSLSLLSRPSSDRVAALERYPDRAEMPTALVYELALNLAESGDYDTAESLFRNRFFLRAEGGTNVREVWTEVRLHRSLALARTGHCEAAQQIADRLGAAVPGLEFTRDGMQRILESPRTNYLLGEMQLSCGHEGLARERFERAASGMGEAAWAYMAARKSGHYDQVQWHERLTKELTTYKSAGTSWGTYNAAMLEQVLGNGAAANAGFRDALLMPDTRMAYHLSRLGLDGVKE
jgi:tetratricopeptide (TPR) repeat protein